MTNKRTSDTFSHHLQYTAPGQKATRT